MKIIVLCSMFILTSCGASNEEIISENKKCKEAGMYSSQNLYGSIQCSVKNMDNK